jgi:phage gp37-like protein
VGSQPPGVEVSLHISQIRRDGGTQSRVKNDEATVAEYAEVMSINVNNFPAVVVFFDGTDHWLADGFHRLAALERIGRTSDFPVHIFKGDRRSAILHSVRSNTTHGLRRSNEDKRHSVKMLLEDEEWALWSNREIAKKCAVSDHLVAEVRTALTAYSRSEDPDTARTYTTRHGSTAKMRVAKIGGVKKEKAAELPEKVTDNAASRADVKVSAFPIPERNALAQLTHDVLIDTVIGLSADLVEARATIEDLRTKNVNLTTQLEAALAGKAGTVMAGLHAQPMHADVAKSREPEEHESFGSQDLAPNEQVEDIWKMEIPF